MASTRDRRSEADLHPYYGLKIAMKSWSCRKTIIHAIIQSSNKFCRRLDFAQPLLSFGPTAFGTLLDPVHRSHSHVLDPSVGLDAIPALTALGARELPGSYQLDDYTRAARTR